MFEEIATPRLAGTYLPGYYFDLWWFMERYFLHSHCGRVIDDAVYVDFMCDLKGKL